MRPAVRLSRRTGGGFQMEGVSTTPIEGVPDDAGFVLSGSSPWRLTWSATERGWILSSRYADSPDELGRTTASSVEPILAPSSVLLADGRLFRLAMFGASEPRVELGRWDVPGPYAMARRADDGWTLELTAAGEALDAPVELWILTCVELGRLDGWY